MRSSVHYSLKTTIGESGKQWWVNMIVLVCLTRPGSSLLSFLLHSQWGGSEAYWWQKRRVLGSIKALVNHGPKIQEVSIQWSLRQPSNSAIWALGGLGKVAVEEELSYDSIRFTAHRPSGLLQGTTSMLTYLFGLVLTSITKSLTLTSSFTEDMNKYLCEKMQYIILKLKCKIFGFDVSVSRSSLLCLSFLMLQMHVYLFWLWEQQDRNAYFCPHPWNLNIIHYISPFILVCHCNKRQEDSRDAF